MTTKNAGRRRGSVMVEIALVFVIFAVLLIGIMDFSQFLFGQQLLVERVRAAARWGAAHNPTDATSIANYVLYSQTAAPQDAAAPSFGLTRSMVEVSTPDAGTDRYRLVVRVSGYSYRVASPLLASSYLGTPIVVTIPLGRWN